ncbi:MAG TPA: nuclear transport factor 2 family protein [Thermoleophilaceae bacterium]|nr:nuclear transport factor 2 family protein [Thermoleophilaceae bacterium]
MEQNDDVRVVRRAIDALNRRDGEALATCVAPDAEWRVAGLVGEGTRARKGHAEVWGLVRRLDREFEDLRVSGEEVMPAGDAAIVPLRISGRGRRTGVSLQMEVIVRCRIERGRVVGAAGHRTLPEAIRTLLRSEYGAPAPALAA